MSSREVWKTVNVDADTLKKLKIMAHPQPVAAFLRELVNGVEPIDHRLARIEERLDIGDVLIEGIKMSVSSINDALRMGEGGLQTEWRLDAK